MMSLSFIRNFNPRSREGSDCSDEYCDFRKLYFNPRSREGSDAVFTSGGTW